MVDIVPGPRLANGVLGYEMAQSSPRRGPSQPAPPCVDVVAGLRAATAPRCWRLWWAPGRVESMPFRRSMRPGASHPRPYCHFSNVRGGLTPH